MDGLIGSLEEGKADVVLVNNEHSPVMFPIEQEVASRRTAASTEGERH